ncbi:MAG: MBOAT family O-acyltransferase [Bacilli bacterium]
MLFSSISFLFIFLPTVILVYFLVPKKFKNITLLIFSLFFYFWGEGIYVLLLIFSCIVNYLVALLIEKNKLNKKKKVYFIISLIFNIGLLIYFKYTNFFIENINSIFSFNISLRNIIMPLGISFFTFQILSYVIDVYKGAVKADKSFIDFTTYVTLFPQLVAGPIVRYVTIKSELKKKDISFENFAYGIKRFIIGLSKKVILANNLGLLIELLNKGNESVLQFWIVSISFALQIYFDFSGYSDMAIGMGRMFGFKFLENFNYPYIAKSVTDFWRRWHISLSSFFRDYIYFPLGGNRCSKVKWIRNIIIVWALTGAWHGASWNFIIWGLFFATFLLLEKTLWGKWFENKKIINHIYTLLIVLISFVIFNSSSISEIIINLKSMFFMRDIPLINEESIYYFKSYFVLLVISVVGCLPLLNNLCIRIKSSKKFNKIYETLEIIILIILFIIVVSYLVDSTFNPFLYFRF